MSSLTVHAIKNTGADLTGAAADITCRYQPTEGAALVAIGDTSPVELAAGLYQFALTDAERDGLIYVPEVTGSSVAPAGSTATVTVIDKSEPEPATTLSPSLYQTNRFAAFAEVPKIAVGQSLDFTLSDGSGEIATKTVAIANGYNNIDNGTTITISTHFDLELGRDATGLSLSVQQASGSTVAVADTGLFEPDERFGAAPLFMDAVHCFPTACIWQGQLAEIVTEAGSSRRQLSIGGRPIGELFANIPAGDREPFDKYHNGSAVTKAGRNLVAGMTDHQKRLWITWGHTESAMMSRKPLAVTDAGDSSTYIGMAGASDGSVWIATRILKSSGEHELHLLHVTGLDGPSQTVRTIVLGSMSSHRFYLRHFSIQAADDGHDIVVIGGQQRSTVLNDSEWDQAWMLAYDTATDLVHSYNGNTNGNTDDGTTAAPKVSVADWFNASFGVGSSPSGLGGLSEQHRYALPMAIRIESWNDTSKRLWGLFGFVDVDTDDADAEDGGATRLCFITGPNRYVTSVANNVFDANNATSYRHTCVPRFVDDRNAEVWLGVKRGAFTASDDYNQFGADGPIERFTLNLSNVADDADLASRVIKEHETLPINTDWTADVRGVEGSHGLIISEAVEGSHLDGTRGVARKHYYGLPVEAGQAAVDSRDSAKAAKTAAESADTKADGLQTAADSDNKQTVLTSRLDTIESQTASGFSYSIRAVGSDLEVSIYSAFDSYDTGSLIVENPRAGEYEPGIPVGSPEPINEWPWVKTYAGRSEWAGQPLKLTGEVNQSGGTTNPIRFEYQPETKTVAIGSDTVAGLSDLPSGGAGGSGTTTDVEDANVPKERTAILSRCGGALRNEEPLYLVVGESGDNAPLLAARFAADVSVGGRVNVVDSVTIDGEPDGLTVSSVSTFKRDKSEVKFVLDATEAGSYVVRIKLRYADGSGGAVGLVDVVVEA